MNRFTFETKLLKELADNSQESIAISPISVLSLLNLLKLGSKGLAYGELATINGLDGNFVFKDKDIKLNNFLLHALGVQMRGSYLDSLAPVFNQTSVRSINFAAPKAYDIVNEIVKMATNGMINNAFSQLPKNISLLLLNTLYFNMQWQKPFDKESIKESDFHIGEKTIAVSMMSGKAEQYVDTKTHWGFIKNYKNNNFAFIGMLPKNPGNIRVPEDYEFQNMVLMREQNSVEIEFPKFEIESKVDLKPALENIGIKTVFSQTADFSNMTNSKVIIDEIRHQTKLIVSDEGTEGAAVTAAMIKMAAVRTKPKKLIFDRPFFYMIINKETQQVLFIGKYCG